MTKHLLVCWISYMLAALPAQAYTNLVDAYSAIGFDPTAPGNAVVVLFSDPHMNLNPLSGLTPGVVTTNLDPRLIGQVNAMVPPPARIIVSGDLITSYSTTPGKTPDWNVVRARGSNEMCLWLSAIQSFTNIPQTDILWVPGNHDQDPRETNAELFCQMFPTMPPYQFFDLAGIRFFLLNGGNQAFPSEAERQWLNQQVDLTSPTQTVAVVIHQQPFISGRGNPILLRECFQTWQAPWWVFCGHGHYLGAGAVYDIGSSNVFMCTLGSANTNAFHGQDMNPGFLVLCLSNGIAGRIYFHLKDGSFQALPEPDWRHPVHYAAAFEDETGLLWRREKTPGRMPEVIVTNIWYDAGYSYAGPNELQWALPLGLHGNQATHFLLLSYLSGSNTMSFSADRTNWIEVPIPERTNLLYAFPIPASMASMPTGYARFCSFSGDLGVDAWGLATTHPPPWTTFPQLAPVPDQSTIAGRLFTLTNLAIDPYAPPDTLTFSLLSAPAGATIDSHSGLFSWRPTVPDSPTTAIVAVKVCDSGSVPMCATQQFSIAVIAPDEQITLFEDQFESGSLGLWTGKNGGAIHGKIVSDPLNPANHVLTFTGVNFGGDMFSATHASVDPSHQALVLSFDLLAQPLGGVVPSEYGGFAGIAANTTGLATFWLGGTYLEALHVPPPSGTPPATDGQWHHYTIDCTGFAAANHLTSLQVVLEDWSERGSIPGDVFFDNVKLTAKLYANPMAVSPLWSSGQCSFEVWGSSGVGYAVWSSTNLVDWTLFDTVYPSALPVRITDPAAGAGGCRFYRVSVVPWKSGL